MTTTDDTEVLPKAAAKGTPVAKQAKGKPKPKGTPLERSREKARNGAVRPSTPKPSNSKRRTTASNRSAPKERARLPRKEQSGPENRSKSEPAVEPAAAASSAPVEANADYPSERDLVEREANGSVQVAEKEPVDAVEGELAATAPTSEPSTPWIWRHALAVGIGFTALTMFVAAAGAYLFAESRTDVWQAESEIVLQSPTGQIDRFLATSVVLAQSATVIDRAADVVDLSSVEIQDDLRVTPIDAAVAIRVSFDHEDPELAVAVVDAVVSAYLTEAETETTDTTRAVYASRIDELRAARAEIETELAEVEAANAAAEALELPPPNVTEERRLALESAQLLEQISGLEGQLLVTDIASLNETQATVVTPSRLLDDRVAPSPLTFVALGLLVGGVLSATTLFLVGSMRTRRTRAS